MQKSRKYCLNLSAVLVASATPDYEYPVDGRMYIRYDDKNKGTVQVVLNCSFSYI